jgi:hypothetical protein
MRELNMSEKGNGNAAKGGITKKEGVRQALAALGTDAARVEIQKFIKDHFGLDVHPDHISSCKGEILNEKGKKKPAAAKQPVVKKEPAPKSAADSVNLHDIELVKHLVELYGPDSLKKLIAMLAK